MEKLWKCTEIKATIENETKEQYMGVNFTSPSLPHPLGFAFPPPFFSSIADSLSCHFRVPSQGGI